MRRKPRHGLALLSLSLLTACLSSTPSPAPSVRAEVGINIWCQEASCPEGRVLVEVGSVAFEAAGADGSVLDPAESPVQVRILDPDNCEIFAEFLADPTSRYVVQLSTARPAKIVDTTKEEGTAFPMGPSMGEATLSSCP